jgi:two-component system response regulator HupR/HoxA
VNFVVVLLRSAKNSQIFPLSPRKNYGGKTIDEVIEAIERRMIQDALKKHRWNKQKAAQELGLSGQGLAKKLKRLTITG